MLAHPLTFTIFHSSLPISPLRTMSRRVEIPTSIQNYTLEALKQGFRIDLNQDRRQLDQIRTPQIHLSQENGYVELQWGQTKVAVRVSAKISKPYEDRPFEGTFQINCEISLMAWAKFENQSNKLTQEIVTSRLIEKAIKRLNSLDLESLCIVAGEKVWGITADINYLNYDGGLIDLGCFAVMLALQHFRKPDVTINGLEVEVHTDRPVPLLILHIPICVSYLFFNRHREDLAINIKGDLNDEMYIVDANKEEEALADGLLVVTLNKNRELIQISKNGGLPIDARQLVELCVASTKIVDDLTQLMHAELERFELEQYKAERLDLLEGMATRTENAMVVGVNTAEAQTGAVVGAKALPME